MLRLLACLPAAGLALLLSGCGGSSSADSKTTSAGANKPVTRADLEKQLADIKADIDRRKAAGTPAGSQASAAPETATASPAADPGSGTEVYGLSGPITEPCPPAPGPLPAASAAARQYADQAMRVAGFMALYPISADDQHRLRAHLLRNYERLGEQDHAAVRAAYKGYASTSSDPISSASLREQYAKYIGGLVAAHPDQFRDGLWGMVQKYNPVLVVHEGQVVTKSSVHNRLATHDMLAKAAGVLADDPRSVAEQVAAKCREVVRGFARLPAAERLALVEGETEYASIGQMLRSKLPAGRQAAAWIKANVRSEDDLARAHPELRTKAIAFITTKNNAQMAAFRRDMNAMRRANDEITRMGILANENTRLQSRPSANQ